MTILKKNLQPMEKLNEHWFAEAKAAVAWGISKGLLRMPTDWSALDKIKLAERETKP